MRVTTRRTLGGAHVPPTKTKIRKLGKLAPQPHASYRKVIIWPGKLPGPWTTTWSKQYLSTVHPVTRSQSEVPVWPTSTDLRLSDFPVPASGLWSGSGSKVNQFVHVPTPVDTQNFIQIHASILSNLANRQTDRQTSRAIAYNSFFVEGKLAIFLTSQSLYCFAICHVQDGHILWYCRFQADVFEIPANVYIQHFKTYRFITEIHDIL